MLQQQRQFARTSDGVDCDDLPVIEKIDQLGSVDSVEFLERLQSEGLFAAEVDDGM